MNAILKRPTIMKLVGAVSSCADGEKCEPRDTTKDAVKYLLDLAADQLKIPTPDYNALLIVSTDFLELLHKLNNRYLGRYPSASC
jgi:hypothetical protein